MEKYKKGLISIIIPLYNGEKHIVETIESCLNQSYKNVEIIIIDDGSTDKAYEKIKNFIDSAKVKYYYQEQKGVSSARNSGLEKAEGEYIQFLDADDLLAKDKLEKQVDFLSRNKDIFGVYCETKYFRDNIENIVLTLRREHNGFVFKELLKGNFIPIHSILIRNNEAKFNTDYHHMEDWQYWLQVLKDKKIVFLDNSSCYVRLHSNNVSNNVNKMLEYEIEILLKYLKAEDLKPYKGIIYYKIFCNKYLLRDGQWKGYFIKSIKENRRNTVGCVIFLGKNIIKRILKYNSHVYK